MCMKIEGRWFLTYLLEDSWLRKFTQSQYPSPFSPSLPPDPLFERHKNSEKFQQANATAICICYKWIHPLFQSICDVLFFLGCGHCKSLAPTYEKLGEAFAKSDDVIIAKVDADGDKTLGSRFGVSGFPTLKYFSKGSTSAEE